MVSPAEIAVPFVGHLHTLIDLTPLTSNDLHRGSAMRMGRCPVWLNARLRAKMFRPLRSARRCGRTP
jgi:hypothetical protein